MPRMVRIEHDLPTLRIHVARDDREELKAVFEVVRGQGPVSTVREVPTRSLGLADRIRSARDVSESKFRLSPDVVDSLRTALVNLAADDVPAYWLELPSPRGYLQLLPWERLLSPALGRPLLRLPNFTLRPNAPGPTLRIVVVAGRAVGTPDFDAATLVAAVADTWARSVTREVIIDVFVDAESFPDVRDRLAGDPRVTMHDPSLAPDVLLGPTSRGAEDDEVRTYPWLQWVTTELAGIATDVVHILCHGHISADRGALALPASPSASGADRFGRFIGPVKLCRALARLGAWSLLLSGVPGNHCPPGLRDLADAVSQARSGVVLLHQMAESDPVAELGSALSMVFGGLPQYLPLPGITCWSHPAFVAYQDKPALCDADGTSALIAGATHEVLSNSDTPAWVAAGTRVLETLQAEWTPVDGSAFNPQAMEALREVSKLFDDHVRTYALPDSEQHPGATS